ncbi:MAG: thioredoxin family protein [Prolixibacteraceae bacterium]|nr:thioredoxin family protein [Prolixibacteraceae bacterium]
MKTILNLNELKKTTTTNEKVWLLLYKRGSEKSDCAIENFMASEKNLKKGVLLCADVNEVRDIHPEFGVTTVPTLLHFENSVLKNTIKGCHSPEQFNAIFENSAWVPKTTDENKIQKNVVVYTTPSCSWCNTVKRYFQQNGIKFREIDVSADHKAAEEMVRKSGQQGVPQTEINGQMVVGYDKVKINSLLGIN